MECASTAAPSLMPSSFPPQDVTEIQYAIVVLVVPASFAVGLATRAAAGTVGANDDVAICPSCQLMDGSTRRSRQNKTTWMVHVRMHTDPMRRTQGRAARWPFIRGFPPAARRSGIGIATLPMRPADTLASTIALPVLEYTHTCTHRRYNLTSPWASRAVGTCSGIYCPSTSSRAHYNIYHGRASYVRRWAGTACRESSANHNII